MTLRIEDLGVFCGGNWLNNARILLVNPPSTEIGMLNMSSWKAKKLVVSLNFRDGFASF
jgi:hypothetical protein